MKINTRSEILDVSQLASGSKQRDVLLESIMWIMQLIKSWDRSERSPHIFSFAVFGCPSKTDFWGQAQSE
jgi:hypothetical protein